MAAFWWPTHLTIEFAARKTWLNDLGWILGVQLGWLVGITMLYRRDKLGQNFRIWFLFFCWRSLEFPAIWRSWCHVTFWRFRISKLPGSAGLDDPCCSGCFLVVDNLFNSWSFSNLHPFMHGFELENYAIIDPFPIQFWCNFRNSKPCCSVVETDTKAASIFSWRKSRRWLLLEPKAWFAAVKTYEITIWLGD